MIQQEMTMKLSKLLKKYCHYQKSQRRLSIYQKTINISIAALSISEDSDYQLYLKRPPNSCFVNNYFTDGLLAWEANIDIQPVFNHYKAVAYMCTYISKSEDECSQAMRQALKEAFEDKQMKSVAQKYINKTECSIKQCVYQFFIVHWFRKTFPGVIFANSNITEKRYRICREEKDISQLSEYSRDISKRI